MEPAAMSASWSSGSKCSGSCDSGTSWRGVVLTGFLLRLWVCRRTGPDADRDRTVLTTNLTRASERGGCPGDVPLLAAQVRAASRSGRPRAGKGAAPGQEDLPESVEAPHGCSLVCRSCR